MPRDEAERDERTMDGAAESRVSPRLSVTERPPPVRLLRLLIKDIRPRTCACMTCSRKYSRDARLENLLEYSILLQPSLFSSFPPPPFFLRHSLSGRARLMVETLRWRISLASFVNDIFVLFSSRRLLIEIKEVIRSVWRSELLSLTNATNARISCFVTSRWEPRLYHRK